MCTRKSPATAGLFFYALLHHIKHSSYEAIGVPIQAVLTDNGRQFCGKSEQHPYELMLALEVHRASHYEDSNPAHQRLHRAHEPHAPRRMLPRRRASDLVHRARRNPARPDAFLRYYNLERSHQGYRLKGRTPTQALREALAIQTLPPVVPEPEVTTEIEPDTLAA